MKNYVLTLAAAVLGVTLVSAAETALCGAHGIVLKADNGQSPCEIASLMVGKGVVPTDSPFPELEAQNLTRYPIPKMVEADELRCNMIFYNLVSGCAACQLTTNTWASWDEWTSHCKTQSSVSYIASVMPYDTPIPGWAFTDAIATGGTFNATAAKAVASNLFDVPDTVFNVKSEQTSAPAASSACSFNSGVIAGGTVGGFVAGIVLGVLGALFVAARKKNLAAQKNTEDGQHSIHSQDTQDTVGLEKAHLARND